MEGEEPEGAEGKVRRGGMSAEDSVAMMDDNAKRRRGERGDVQ